MYSYIWPLSLSILFAWFIYILQVTVDCSFSLLHSVVWINTIYLLLMEICILGLFILHMLLWKFQCNSVSEHMYTFKYCQTFSQSCIPTYTCTSSKGVFWFLHSVNICFFLFCFILFCSILAIWVGVYWVFIGRTDAEAETPILWPPHAKSWLVGKDPDAGRDWEQEKKEMTEDEMAGWHHRLDGHVFE